MKKMIRNWFLVLCIMVAMCASVVTAAETTPAFVAENQSVEVGDTIVIPVLIQNNTGVMGMGLDIAYDAKVFEKPAITRGSVLAGGTFNDSITEETNGTFKVLWSDTSETTENGTLFSISLDVKSSASIGDYMVTISNRTGDTFDEEYNDVAIKDCACTISVAKKEVEITKVLKSISVTKQPEKTLYSVGDYFDETGMEVTAAYDDGTTQIITDYVVSPDYLSEKDTAVTITYYEDGVAATTTVPIEVQPVLSTNSKAASIAVNNYYGVMEYVGFDYAVLDKELDAEIEVNYYDVDVVLPEGEEVTKDSITVSTFDKDATIKGVVQSEEGNWVVTIYAQDTYYASVYTIKITETADKAELGKAKIEAATSALANHEDAIKEWFAEVEFEAELTEETAKQMVADYINDIPEIAATGYTFTGDDVIIYMLELPTEGTADEPTGIAGILTFEAYIEDGDTVISSDMLVVGLPAKKYNSVTNLEIVQECKKLLDSKRVSLKDTGLTKQDEICSYIAQMYQKVLIDAGYDIEITAADINVVEYLAPEAGSLDDPSGENGCLIYTVNISSGNSTEVTNERALSIEADAIAVYTITATAGTNGSISPAGNSSVLKGGEISYVITAASGYKIEKVLVDQVSVGAVTAYKFTNVQANHTISVTFVKSTTSQGATTTPSKPTVPTVKDGEVFTIGNLQYKVTSILSYSLEVKLTKVTSKSIKTLVIPDMVTYKGKTFKVTSMASDLCKNFKKITKAEIGNNIKEIPKNVFYKCKKLKSIKIGYGVVKIGTQAFYGCEALKTIDNCAEIKTINSKAFYGCKKLQSTGLLYDVITIGDSAFMNCSKFAYVYLPSIKKIGKKAFYNCKNIMDVTISSKKLSSVGSKVFGNIKSDADIYLAEKKFSKYKKMLKGKCPSGVSYYKD